MQQQLSNSSCEPLQFTVGAAHAIPKYNEGINCATITPDEARIEELGFKDVCKSVGASFTQI
jgi:isocitrate dehydrogenase